MVDSLQLMASAEQPDDIYKLRPPPPPSAAGALMTPAACHSRDMIQLTGVARIWRQNALNTTCK